MTTRHTTSAGHHDELCVTGCWLIRWRTPGCPRRSTSTTSSTHPTIQPNSFEFHVTQQSFNALGVITISNIHYTTTADARCGPGALE